MPLKWFKCPDGKIIEVDSCLAKCRMELRCLTKPTLLLISTEREWNGVPSTTQLLNGTMLEFLKLTKDYTVDPDKRAFMLAGTKHHEGLEEFAKLLGLPSEIPLNIDRDIFDLLEPEDGGYTLTDYKLWGSYRVAKALGIIQIGKQPDPSGAVYKSSGRWGKAGDPKMVPVFEQVESEADNWEAELQLNRYRVMLEQYGVKVVRMQIQATVRDGGLEIAYSRGVIRNTAMMPIKPIPNNIVVKYFSNKEKALLDALVAGRCDTVCDARECWDGARCKSHCEVAEFCPKGVLYQQGIL